MRNQRQCPHCDSTQLLRIGVRGIRKCANCGSFVDVRRRWLANWLKAG
ncbi:MAG: hypothetical protein F6K04_00805 [Leptolyngbya sp. SIO4C5]|nr:hypothetical protein [Leptolyngbya sp. SIO4C5]